MKANENLLNDFTNWIQESIDSWIQNSDDCYEDMEQLERDLDIADEYFYNNLDNFTEEYGYDPNIEWSDEFDEIISEYVESSKEYLEDKYDCWRGDNHFIPFGDDDYDEDEDY